MNVDSSRRLAARVMAMVAAAASPLLMYPQRRGRGRSGGRQADLMYALRRAPHPIAARAADLSLNPKWRPALKGDERSAAARRVARRQLRQERRP